MNFLILSTLLPLVSSAPTPQCLNISHVDAITSLINGTVLIASDNFYWFVDNNTMKEVSSGLIGDLIPHWSSLNLAVSIRTSIRSQSTETLVFQTFEKNEFKTMVYENQKWTDGRQYVMDLVWNLSKTNVTLNQLKQTKLFALYFKDEGNPVILLALNNTIEAYSLTLPDSQWTRLPKWRQAVEKIADKRHNANSVYVKDPEEYMVHFTLFSGNQFVNCKIKSVGQNAEEECDSQKQIISQLIPCLLLSKKMTESLSKSAKIPDKNSLIYILVGILSFALFMLIAVIFIIWCCCRRRGKTSSPQNEEQKDLDPNKEPLPQQMQAPAENIIDIEKRVKEQLKEKTPKTPKTSDQTVKDKTSKKKEKTKMTAKKEKKDKTETTFVKKSTKVKQNIKELKNILSETDKPKQTKETDKPKEEPKAKSEVEAKPVSEVKSKVSEKAVDEKVKQLLSQKSTARTQSDEKVNQLLNWKSKS